MHPDEPSAAGQSRDRDVGDPLREGLEHLHAAGRELVAAARAAIGAIEEIVDDPEAVRDARASVSEFFRTVARSTGLASSQAERTADAEASTETHDERTSGVEHIPLDPGR